MKKVLIFLLLLVALFLPPPCGAATVTNDGPDLMPKNKEFLTVLQTKGIISAQQAETVAKARLRRAAADDGDEQEEEYLYPEWIEDNEQAWELFGYLNSNPQLYPGEIPDPWDGSYSETELEEARNIIEFADYVSVKNWVDLRATLRVRYEAFRAKAEQAYKAGQLGPEGTEAHMLVEYMDLCAEIYEHHEGFLAAFNEEWESRHYVYGGTSVYYLRDGDPTTVEYSWLHRDPGYTDYYLYSYRDLDLTGYAISVTNKVESPYYVKMPDKWELYGYYSSPDDTRAYYDIDLSEYTLLDAHDQYLFPWAETARKVFAVSHPARYNRFVLRFFYTENGRDVQRLAFSQFELLEGVITPSDDINTSDPELPHMAILHNENKTWESPIVILRSDVGQPDSPFDFLDRNEEPGIIFRHADPQYEPYVYETSQYINNRPYFDEQGYLRVHVKNKFGVPLSQLSSFPAKPNHFCDIIITYKVVERATGRIYSVTDTIPYYLRYPDATIEMADTRIIGTEPTQEETFTAIVRDITYDKQGFIIDVEISDYASGSYATRHLTLDHNATPIPSEYADPEGYKTWFDNLGNEWVTFTKEYNYIYYGGDPVAVLNIPVVCGQEDVVVKVTANNKYGETSTVATAHICYERVDVDQQLKGTYALGENGEGPVFDLKDWTEDNQPQRDALDKALLTQDYNTILDAYDAYNQSRYRVITFASPEEWGPSYCESAQAHISAYFNPGEGKFYIKAPATNAETYSVTIYWEKAHVSKTFTFRSVPLPEDKYVFRPIVEGASGDRSITMYYSTPNSDGITSKTVIGRFGSDETAPSCIVIDEPIFKYSYICFRDNATQASSYHNKTKSADRRWGDLAEGPIIHGSYDNEEIKHIGLGEYNRYGDQFDCDKNPIKDNYKDLLHVFESTLTETPVIRLQFLDEDGTPISDAKVAARVVYIAQPVGEPIPMGTSSMFNPFIQGETVMANRGVDGIIDIKLPTPEPGYVHHAFIEVGDSYWEAGAANSWNPSDYNTRLISELTTPEAFTDYINKGLPYPCVLTKRTSDTNVTAANIFVRPAEAEPFGPESVSYPVIAGSEMDYEGGEKNRIDVLAKFAAIDRYHTLGEGTPTTLPDGTVETPWLIDYAFKILAPNRAYKSYYTTRNGRTAKEGIFDNNQIDAANIVTDKKGRDIVWARSQTGFNYNYFLLSCEPYHILPNMKKGDEHPASDAIVLALFDKRQLDSKGSVNNTTNFARSYSPGFWTYNPLDAAPLATAYNTAVEEVDPESYIEDMANTSTPGYDGSIVNGNDKSFSKISGGLAGFNMATPGCLPFLNVLVTSEKGEYRVRSSFELNAMDIGKPAFGAWDKIKDQQQRVNDVSGYLQQFLLIKNSCLGDYTTDIFNTDDGVFVGFKGFTEMAIIKDYKENVWKPYFTGFGAKLEASAQFTWKMQAPPFIAKMVTRGEVSSSFMLLNPHPKDFVYTQALADPKQGLDAETFNPYSHFNMYVNSTFDLQLCMQGGIGFDAGFIAAHGGLMGKARAAARFAYVNRPYLTGSLRESSGARFDLAASLSAYAYFKFLFLKYTKEWEICGVEKTFWKPDNDWNPLKSDPNLRPELLTEGRAKVHARPLTAIYMPQRHRVSVIGSRTISDKVDIFANPIYLNGGERLAFFNINNPSDPNDDRVLVSGEGCNVGASSHIYGDNVPAFTYHAASAGTHQIVAVQRLGEQLSGSESSMTDANRLTNQLQIVASVGNSTGTFVPTIVSASESANIDPRAAIAQNGNAAIVWGSGTMSLKETTDEEGDTYTEPILKGDLVLSLYDSKLLGGTWSAPVKLVSTGEDSPVKDYAIATGGSAPLVMASIPGINALGERTAPTFLITAIPSTEPGKTYTTRRTALGFEGAQHQLVAVYENGTAETNHFIASSLVNADTLGHTDIVLYDIRVAPDGTIRNSSLGRLGLNKYRILSYRLVSPKAGTTGVDGLGIIWNQHEQENTDDETLDAEAFNRTYVARINRRADYIYLSHAAQALDLPDAESVADMTAYMDYDDGRQCPIVTAAFCIGETQVDGASTAASIIEKTVSLNNEVQWLEAESGLTGIIDKKNGTEIRLAVRNIGLHTIRRFTVEMAGHTFEQEAKLTPSERTAVTIKLPAGTDFSSDIPFTITAHFYDIDLTDSNDPGRSTGTASTIGAFRVNVVDMCTGLTLNRFDKDTGKDAIVISVSNLSPMALKAGNTVKVSLFTDALGDTQYPGVATFSIPASQLYNAATRSALVKTVRFFVDAPSTRTTIYAICRTVDADGNVVFDQNSSDNTLILSLAPRNTDNGIEEEKPHTIGQLARLIQALKTENPTPDQDYTGDGIVDKDDFDALLKLILAAEPDRLTIDDLENPQLKVSNNGDSIVVEGLNPDKDLKVFDATGQLINWTEPGDKQATVKVNRKGTLIVVNDGKAGVIRH